MEIGTRVILKNCDIGRIVEIIDNCTYMFRDKKFGIKRRIAEKDILKEV